MAFRQVAAKLRIGEPDAAILVRRQVVGRVERLAVELSARWSSNRPLPSAPRGGNNPGWKAAALEVETVAVGGEGRPAHHRDLAGLPQIAVERVVLDVAEHGVEAHATRPGLPGNESRWQTRRMVSCRSKGCRKRVHADDVGIGREHGGGALGPKSRGGLVITDSGVPTAACPGACASAGNVAAAPASIRRRLSSVTAFLPMFFQRSIEAAHARQSWRDLVRQCGGAGLHLRRSARWVVERSLLNNRRRLHGRQGVAHVMTQAGAELLCAAFSSSGPD